LAICPFSAYANARNERVPEGSSISSIHVSS
jgi:hypothetical protein